jgi:GT2 family glycosyltransferase
VVVMSPHCDRATGICERAATAYGQSSLAKFVSVERLIRPGVCIDSVQNRMSAADGVQSAAGSVVGTGVVVIGRNEGERLQRCLHSLRGLSERTAYVDSGSTDDSVAMSRRSGAAIVVELDHATPFTAARARNEGFQRLLEAHPPLNYVFFVDGDCEVAPGWVDSAIRFLDQHPDVAVVWGLLRERYPENSVYNLLQDIEWQDYPLGETYACGGIAVVRVIAFQQVQGYRPELICGEESELCIRLRHRGWKIWRIPENMALHDVAMDHFGQWWKRSLRSGYGYAQGAALHGRPPERHWVVESRRAWVWGLWIPLVVIVLAFAEGWWALLLLLVYPLQLVRLAMRGSHSPRENWLRAACLVLGKFPEMLGQLKFTLDRYRHARARLIEYK